MLELVNFLEHTEIWKLYDSSGDFKIHARKENHGRIFWDSESIAEYLEFYRQDYIEDHLKWEKIVI